MPKCKIYKFVTLYNIISYILAETETLSNLKQKRFPTQSGNCFPISLESVSRTAWKVFLLREVNVYGGNLAGAYLFRVGGWDGIRIYFYVLSGSVTEGNLFNRCLVAAKGILA